MGGRAGGHRTLATLPAAGSLRTGQPPPTRSWPGLDSCRSPSAALGGKTEARPPPCSRQTVLQASPVPGLTCPTAHRAGPPHSGPCPGLRLLRLKVGEGDVWAREVTILLPITPVNLQGTDKELRALSTGLPQGAWPVTGLCAQGQPQNRARWEGRAPEAPKVPAPAPTRPHLATWHHRLL